MKKETVEEINTMLKRKMGNKYDIYRWWNTPHNVLGYTRYENRTLSPYEVARKYGIKIVYDFIWRIVR